MAKRVKKKTVLITGATGFIGRHLVRRMVALNHYSIVVISRFPKKAERLTNTGAIIVKADITKKEDLRELTKFPVDIIIHCAALVESKKKKMLDKVNIAGTENICKLAVELGAERLVYLSSVAVVSGNRRVPLVENLPYFATNLYGQSKLEAEKKVLLYRQKGLPVVILRPPMVYGEDEPHALPVLLNCLKWRIIPLLEGGKHKLHLAYVKNVVEAIIFALENKEMLKGSFFVADEQVLTTREVFKKMAEGAGAKLPLSVPHFLTPFFCNFPFLGRYFKFFLKDRAYSIEKIESLGFKPPYRAEDALAKSSKACFENKR
ncbi:MAG: SDR family NAD(P)-dependent oxidoreductase [Candidatus Omnitrophica bacterium]|nr:SDR family NAD(P)-dependent oxidoreductase [Candidatus Omnitrophota bacterium]MCF7891903.1 SDR family NAD(P)-dependent oxidoreductase [Candidatus Omnitrophota bacterium]MCF7895427.1 SDR family NAD(P)-dependent oxidoreductase [Candidatus Omnitrophota bacterium]MCF7897938.1 SDR family NAD(P)-dependent oxidoreductase [Candidatus Omnitrophota bacterium]MCF7909624.1 SDR family NAD(P)-dependent oxidoreductase [Candidatus Omnitrophota bacterium]